MSNPSIRRSSPSPLNTIPSSPSQVSRTVSPENQSPSTPTKLAPSSKSTDPQLINTETEALSLDALIDNLDSQDMDKAITQSEVLSEQALSLQEETPAQQLETLNQTVKNNPEVKAKINDYKALFGKQKFSETLFADLPKPLKEEALAFKNASANLNKTLVTLASLLENKSLSSEQKQKVTQLQGTLTQHMQTFNESHQKLKTMDGTALQNAAKIDPLKGRLNASVHSHSKGNSNNEVSAFMHLFKMTQANPEDAVTQLLKGPLDKENDGFITEAIAQDLQQSSDPAGRLATLVGALSSEDPSLANRQNQIFQGISAYLENKLDGRSTESIDAMISTLKQPDLAKKMGETGTQCCVRLALHPLSQIPENDSTDQLSKDLVRLEKAHPQNKKTSDPFARPTATEVECGNYGDYQSLDGIMDQVKSRISTLVNDKTSQSDLKTLAHRTLMLPDQEHYHDLFDHLAQSHQETRLTNPNEAHYGKTYQSITLEKDAFNALLNNKSHVCLERLVFEDPERQTHGKNHAFRYTGAIEGSEARRITGREQTLGEGKSLVVGYEGGGTHSSAGHVSFASTIETRFKDTSNSRVDFNGSAQRIDGNTRFITVKAPMLLLSKTDDWRPNANVDPLF